MNRSSFFAGGHIPSLSDNANARKVSLASLSRARTDFLEKKEHAHSKGNV